MTKLLWISDLHYAAEPILGHDPAARIAAAVAYVNRHHGDALGCILSGDLTEHGTEAEYHALAGMLDDLAVPWFPLAGNHDDRAALRKVLPLPGDAMDDFVQYRVEMPGVEILCLDTLSPGAAAGAFCAARLDWLAGALRRARTGARLVFMHHPPLRLGLPALDPDRLPEAEPVLDLIAGEGAVQHLFCGHVHRPVSGVVRGVPFAALRSLLIQAPPPEPAWDWETFAPAAEAPEIGVIRIAGDDIAVQYIQPCDHRTGVAEGGV